MATANELFAANGEDYIVIDSDLRTMTFPASVNNIGVENDKDVHKLNFKMPRYFSGYDLSEFIIHINYVNANGDADMYYVLDPTVEENEIIFSWLVGRHACLYRGSVTFIVCLKLADGEGDVAQEFNTTLASLQVLPGLETEPTILETEHDVIEQLLLSINDTNAKIKAVLDTGLTPEQIAEFYNKSKTYDTQITELNSSKRYYVTGSAPILAITLSNNIDGQNYVLTNTRGDSVQISTEGSTLTIVKYNVSHTGTYNVYKSSSIIYVGIKFGSSYGTRGWSVFGPDGFNYSLSRVASIPSDAIEATVITSQVDALNSSSMRYFPVAKIPQGADLDTIYSGNYFCNTNTLHQTILHKPSGVATIWRLHVIAITNDGESDPSTMNAWMKRIQILEDETGVVFQRTIKGTGSTSPVIGEWEKLPTRAEIDALNSSLIVPNNRVTIPDGSDINTYITPGVYAVASDASASTMTNIPRNASGKLIVMVRGNNLAYIQQKYITTSSAYIEYVRNYNNGTWTAWEQLPTRAEIDALNNKTAVDVTAGANVTIDTNKSYAVGKMLFLSVKGHASADVNNAELFTISGITANPTEYTFFCGVGAAWSLTGIGYCYINGNKVNGRITSGQYFHICATIPID